MADESTPDLRWLVERIDRNHAETSADIAKLETQVAAIPTAMDRYVLAVVYEAHEAARRAREEALDARLDRIEDDDKAKRRAVRSAWLAAGGAIVSALGLEIINAVTRGTGHG